MVKLHNPPATAYAWVGLLVRLGLAAVWVFAGIGKLADPNQAAQAVRAYDVLPESVVEPLGHGLPFLELALALLLVLGIGTRVVAFVSGLLLLVFIAAIGQAWARGLTIDCGCFGGGGAVDESKTTYLQEILRDIGFLVLVGWLLWRPRTALSADEALSLSSEPSAPTSGD